jgi:septal ring factor EnvC (AmiA/AmiB activator)
VSSVPRHSEEELRQQWAFLDALVDRQAASLKSGVQDPEEDDLTVPMAAPDATYIEEISTLTQRVTTLEDERSSLLRRIDLAEEARMAAESGRAAAEAARLTAERALAEERSRVTPGGGPTKPPVPPRVAHPTSRRKSWWQRIRE